MSDALEGGSGSDGPKVSAEIEFIVKGINQAVATIKSATKTMEKDVANFDKTLDAVNLSLRIMATNARTSFQKAKEAAAQASTELTNAQTKLTKSQGKNQVSRQAHLETMKDKTAEMRTDDQAHAKWMQRAKTRSQTSAQNFKSDYQSADIKFKQGTQLYNQQMAALKSTNQISKQNHQVVIQNLKNTGITTKVLHTQQTAALNANMKLGQQAHQITMSNLNAQNRLVVINGQTQGRIAVINAQAAARAARGTGGAGGGGGGGLLGGLGKVLGGLTGKGGGLGAVAGTLAGGVAGGAVVAGVTMVTNAIIDGVAASDELVRSYERQNLAGKTLANTQGELNQLLAVYDKATGEALSKSKQMEGVVRLQAVGFADSKEELDKFSRSIRGISLAIGEPADYVTQNLILELFSQRGQRLDQLGLQYDKVRERQAELMDADKSLTKQQAYQNAVLDQALERYGALSDSLVGQATGVESLSAAWDDLGLAMAKWVQNAATPVANMLSGITDKLAEWADAAAKIDPDDVQYKNPEGGIFSGLPGGNFITQNQAQYALDNSQAAIDRAKFDQIEISMGRSARSAEVVAEELATAEKNARAARLSLNSIMIARQRERNYRDPTPGGTGTYDDRPKKMAWTDEQEAEIIEFTDRRAQIEADANQAILDENQEYGQKRIDSERDYQQQLAEDAEDFARQRARDQADFAKDLNKAMMDSAKQEMEIKEDLAKNIAKANRDHQNDLEKWERDHGLRIRDLKNDAAKDEKEVNDDLEEKQAEAKKDSGKKILELEEEFARDRAKAARAHNETILEAASHLDANAVFWEQKKFAREKKEAEEEQSRKLAKEKEGLTEELTENEEASQKRIDEIHANLAEQIREEKEAHELRVKDANEAHALQLADQQAAAAERLKEEQKENAERLQEMKDAHKDRLDQEDIDRGIRLGREATHHNNELLEIDRIHGERITQIGQHATKEQTALEAAHRQRMIDLGFQQGQWNQAEKRHTDRALKAHEIYLKQDNKLTLEAQKASLLRRAGDPTISSDEAESIRKSVEYIGRMIGEIDTGIEKAQGELDALPLPDIEVTSSAKPLTGTSTDGTLVKSSSIDLGIWKPRSDVVTGAGTGGMMGGGDFLIKIEQGAIVINAAPGQNPSAVGEEFETRLLNVLKKVAKVR